MKIKIYIRLLVNIKKHIKRSLKTKYRLTIKIFKIVPIKLIAVEICQQLGSTMN